MCDKYIVTEMYNDFEMHNEQLKVCQGLFTYNLCFHSQKVKPKVMRPATQLMQVAAIPMKSHQHGRLGKT